MLAAGTSAPLLIASIEQLTEYRDVQNVADTLFKYYTNTTIKLKFGNPG